MAVQTGRARRVPSLGGERLREAGIGYAFVLVPLGVFVLFQLYPMAYAFYVSAHEWGGIEGNLGYVGFDNYRELWHDEAFWTWPPERATALWNTVYYAALVVPLQMTLGLSMALLVNQAIRGRTFFRSAYYFPALVSSAAISAIAIYLLSADGLVNALISGVLGRDFTHPWFGDADTALESRIRHPGGSTAGADII